MAYQPLWLFYVRTIFVEEKLWFCLIHSWVDKGVHTFLKGISPKVRLIARLEIKPVYYETAGQRFTHYIIWFWWK